MDITSIIGYTASAVLMASFVFKDMTKLRVVNTFGCVLFIIYGWLNEQNWPIIIPNTFIVCFNLYHLIRSRN